MEVVGYVRVSSEGHADSTSLDQPLSRIENYCHAFGYELLKVFVEVGRGKDTDNPTQFQAALQMIRGRADRIIALKLTQLSHNARALSAIPEALEIRPVDLLRRI